MTESGLEDFKNIFQDLIDDGYSLYILRRGDPGIGRNGSTIEDIDAPFFQIGKYEISIIHKHSSREAYYIDFDKIYDTLLSAYDRFADFSKREGFSDEVSIKLVIADKNDKPVSTIRHPMDKTFRNLPEFVELGNDKAIYRISMWFDIPRIKKFKSFK